MSSIGPRKPPVRCAPPPNPRFEIFKHTLTRIGAPWWVYDRTLGVHVGHSARYETRAEVEALVTWLTERAAGYPRNPAMDLWPTDWLAERAAGYPRNPTMDLWPTASGLYSQQFGRALRRHR